jgi:acyl dehydratase
VATNDLGAMSDTTTFRREHGPVTSELLVRLATLLNDFNPAHYDLAFAHEIGMPGVIGPGTLLQGWILSDIESGLESPSAAGSVPHGVRSIDLRFRAPFLVGDTVTIEYEVDGDALRAEVGASDGTAEPRVVAVATVMLASRERVGE